MSVRERIQFPRQDVIPPPPPSLSNRAYVIGIPPDRCCALRERGFCCGRLMATGRRPKHSDDGERRKEGGQRRRGRLEVGEELAQCKVTSPCSIKAEYREVLS